MRTLAVLPVALLLAGASTAVAQDVRYNFDKQASFATFKTYKWVALKGAPPLSDLVDRQVKAAVDAELARKGLTRATGGRRRSVRRLPGGSRSGERVHGMTAAGAMGRAGTGQGGTAAVAA